MGVARARRIKPTETAHLRLWVAPDGRVTDSLVATEGAIGSAFLDCLKREVQGWQLLPPQTGKGAYADVHRLDQSGLACPVADASVSSACATVKGFGSRHFPCSVRPTDGEATMYTKGVSFN